MNIYIVSYRKRRGESKSFDSKVEVFRLAVGAYGRAAKLAARDDVIKLEVGQEELR